MNITARHTQEAKVKLLHWKETESRLCNPPRSITPALWNSVLEHQRVEAFARTSDLVIKGKTPDKALTHALRTMAEDERALADVLLGWSDMALLASVWPAPARQPDGRLVKRILHCSEMILSLETAAASMPRIADDPVFYTRQFVPTPVLALLAAAILERRISRFVGREFDGAEEEDRPVPDDTDG